MLWLFLSDPSMALRKRSNFLKELFQLAYFPLAPSQQCRHGSKRCTSAALPSISEAVVTCGTINDTGGKSRMPIQSRHLWFAPPIDIFKEKKKKIKAAL